MIHEKLSGEIIGAAMAVLNELGPGLDEKLYERALVIELRRSGRFFDQQKSYSVYYSGELIGSLVLDTIVDDLVIADPRVWRLLPTHT
jgi:GxxExxY protein